MVNVSRVVHSSSLPVWTRSVSPLSSHKDLVLCKHVSCPRTSFDHKDPGPTSR